MLKIGFCFCFNKKITGKKGEGEGEVLSDRPWWPHLHTSGLSELSWQWPEGSSSDKACKHTTDSSQIQLCALGVCGLFKKKKKRTEREERRRVHTKWGSQGRLHSFGITQLKYEKSSLDNWFYLPFKKGWGRPRDCSKTNYSCLRLELSTVTDHKRWSQCRRKVPGVSFSHPQGLELDNLDEAHLLNWDVAEFSLQIQ